jgi:ubiquinone/menaquinone biosynthesis C-methylase UbiE
MADQPLWYPDEVAHAGHEHLDPEYVTGYDRKAHTDWQGELAVLRGYGLGSDADQCLIDLGAGTGKLALAAAPLCRRVVAVDVSPAMLAIVRAEVERQQVDNVECVRAGFLSYQHSGRPADFIYSRHALHQLPDLWKAVALRRMTTMLKPGGILRVRDLLFSFEPGETEHAVEAWLAGAARTSARGWTRTELEEHLRTEYSTFTWLFEPMLERAGFAIHEAEYDPSRIYAAYVCTVS